MLGFNTKSIDFNLILKSANNHVVTVDHKHAEITPATIIDEALSKANVDILAKGSIPKARGTFVNRDLEEAEREKGNIEFKNGNFTAAVKSYTRCLGLKVNFIIRLRFAFILMLLNASVQSNNFIAFSNRAMAYLKLKEHHRAVTDCGCALSIEPEHVKSLLRRATAFNALGKHRVALLDLLQAERLEPGNKQVKVDMQLTKELLRSAANRAPLVSTLPYGAYLDRFGGFVDHTLRLSISEDELQGPDPAPVGMVVAVDTTTVCQETDVPAVSSSNTSICETSTHATSLEPSTPTALVQADDNQSFHRITIEDSDEEGEVSQGLCDLPSFDATAKETAMKKRATKSATSKKPSSKVSKSKDKAALSKSIQTIRGAYDLEKRLLQCQSNGSQLEQFVCSLDPSRCKQLFSSLAEPDVLYKFLTSAYKVFHARHDHLRTFTWFRNVAKEVESFALVYSLLPIEQKLELEIVLRSVLGHISSLNIAPVVNPEEECWILGKYAP